MSWLKINRNIYWNWSSNLTVTLTEFAETNEDVD